MCSLHIYEKNNLGLSTIHSNICDENERKFPFLQIMMNVKVTAMDVHKIAKTHLEAINVFAKLDILLILMVELATVSTA